MKDNEKIISLYKEFAGICPEAVTLLPGSGSNRKYYRICGAKNCIAAEGESVEENNAFLYLAKYFKSKGLNVPEIYAVSPDHSVYLQEDLGDTLLFDAIAAGRLSGNFSEQDISFVTKSIRALAEIQYRGAEGIDFNRCYPEPAFNRRLVMWDLNYFKYCFLKVSGIAFNEAALEDDFERLSRTLLEDESDTFMYRDFQSRNVMLNAGEPWFFDFQGGRRGPAEYDVASFLWQAKANFPKELRCKMIDEYLDAASKFTAVDRNRFKTKLSYFVLFRSLQVLGAYGFRGLHEHKQHFIESIPAAVMNLKQLFSGNERLCRKYPELAIIVDSLAIKYLSEKPVREKLLVSVTSFSYKKGIPEDASGNGGGFVFDCRGMHNPGRYEQYRQITGRDIPVIEFLEERGEVQPFLQACFQLVDKSVETYIRRGFTSLTVSFGCTGGQHRSVYCAEQMARHLAENYRIDVELCHREQGITERIKTHQ